MIEWVKQGFDHLVELPEMVKRFSEVCDISSLDLLVAVSINSAWKMHYETWMPT